MISSVPEAGTQVMIGRILRPFGVHGEVRVESLTDVPGRFENLSAVTLVLPDGQQLPMEITRTKQSGEGYIVKFSTVDSPEVALSLRGAWIQISPDARPALPPFHYYQCELIGLRVVDSSGQHLGQVEEILDLPHQHLLVIRRMDTEYLLPAVRRFILDVNVSAGIMKVAPVEEWGMPHAV